VAAAASGRPGRRITEGATAGFPLPQPVENVQRETRAGPEQREEVPPPSGLARTRHPAGASIKGLVEHRHHEPATALFPNDFSRRKGNEAGWVNRGGLLSAWTKGPAKARRSEGGADAYKGFLLPSREEPKEWWL